MKASMAISVAVLLHVATAMGHIHHGAGKVEACQTPPCQAAPTPAAAASPAPELPGLAALHITFEIENFNYYDLTKVTCPKKMKVKGKKGSEKFLKDVKAVSKKGGKGPKSPVGKLAKNIDNAMAVEPADANVSKAMANIHGQTDNIAKEIKKATDVGEEPGKLPWANKKMKKDQKEKKKKLKDAAGNPIPASLLQSGACAALPDLAETKSKECTTVMDVLRDAIVRTVRNVIKCIMEDPMALMAPGPAPMPMLEPVPLGMLPAAPAGASGLVPLPPQPVAGAFLQARNPVPAPSPAGAPAPVMAALDTEHPSDAVKIFVTFKPGKEMEGGRSTIVEIAFLDKPDNGVDDVAVVIPHINNAIASKFFHKQIKKALHQVTGIKPKLKNVDHGMKVIRAWEVEKCERHIKEIVQQFTLHYTRNQVPMALYNECTNFMTKMSFSHDHVLDPQDTMRCRKATAKFAKHWDYGENAANSDFEDMCIKACEAKYGRNAPTCNLHSGDELITQPL